jgi:hypothetical protein
MEAMKALWQLGKGHMESGASAFCFGYGFSTDI